MKGSLVVTISLLAALTGGFFLLDETDAGAKPNAVAEQWVNANLIRVRVNGKWEDVPMVPLADHLCQSGNELFKKHCSDKVLAPAKE